MSCSSHTVKLSLLLVMAVLLLCVPAGEALVVDGLYNYRVPVTDESEAERERAFQVAFSGVVLKVTGHGRWLSHPAVISARLRAGDFVEAFAYGSETADPAPDPALEERRYLEVDFAQQPLNEMLRDAAIPLWGSNRPSVLVWIVLQDPGGDRRPLSPDSDPETVELIQRLAAERGLPVIFPLLDFEDRRSLPVDVLWSLDEGAVRAASLRYGADSVLAGRILQTASGELAGLWQFIFQDEAEIFDGLDTELAAYLRVPLGRITDSLADYFAVVRQDAAADSVRLHVDGVRDLATYTALLAYLQGLEPVGSVTIAALNGYRLELELGLEGDVQRLTELIALDRDLLPAVDANLSTGVLNYRWTR